MLGHRGGGLDLGRRGRVRQLVERGVRNRLEHTRSERHAAEKTHEKMDGTRSSQPSSR